jgi:hypothetical protein
VLVQPGRGGPRSFKKKIRSKRRTITAAAILTLAVGNSAVAAVGGVDIGADLSAGAFAGNLSAEQLLQLFPAQRLLELLQNRTLRIQLGFDGALVEHPPLVRETKIFILDRPLSDGRNAVVTHDLRVETPTADGKTTLQKPPSLPRMLTLDTGQDTPCKGTTLCITNIGNGGPVVFNDLGLESDQVAGDGIYSGLLRFDTQAALADNAAFFNRLSHVDERRVFAFTGREVIGVGSFNPQNMVGASVKDPNPAAGKTSLTLRFPLQNSVRATASLFPALPISLPVTTDPKQTLMIVNPLVIADPRYTFDSCNTHKMENNQNPDVPWSFKTLFRGIAGGRLNDTQSLFDDWIAQWLTPDPPMISGTFNLPRMSTLFNSTVDSWKTDADKFQAFRLLAISNRIDLAKASSYGPGSPGELRFVFGLLSKSDCKVPATVILEYKLPPSSCSALKNYAKAWQALGDYDLSDPAELASYLAALQNLTDPVTKPNAIPRNPLGSAIGQVRTNEFGVLPTLREFKLRQLDPFGGFGLRHGPLAQTPDSSLNGNPLLDSYLLGPSGTQACPSSPRLILREGHCVPLTFMGQPFRGAPVSAPDYVNFPWDGSNQIVTPSNLIGTPVAAEWPLVPGQTRPATASDLRFKFALNTCNGCHATETGTNSNDFFQVHPVNDSQNEAQLSGFLTGDQTSVDDPVFGGLSGPNGASRNFNDLQRRAQALEAMADQSCEIFPSLPLSATFPD